MIFEFFFSKNLLFFGDTKLLLDDSSIFIIVTTSQVEFSKFVHFLFLIWCIFSLHFFKNVTSSNAITKYIATLLNLGQDSLLHEWKKRCLDFIILNGGQETPRLLSCGSLIVEVLCTLEPWGFLVATIV